MVGTKFGAWTVLGEGFVRKNKRGQNIYTSKCRCVCGMVRDVSNHSLRAGTSSSCGCIVNYDRVHANAKHPPFFIRGYKVVYHPEHLSFSGFVKHPGYIYEHRYVMEKNLGRPLRKDEHIHHIDGNKSNNVIANLKLISPAEHARHHNRKLAENQGHHHIEERICRRCGKPTSRYGTLCGNCARQKSIKIKLPPKTDFQRMIDTLPLEKVANIVGVSSNAVKKWIRKLGLHYVPFYKRRQEAPIKVCPLE